MANKAKIGASIVLDGEKEFKSAVTACNKKLATMRSELGLVKERYAENANSLTALQEKNTVLTNILNMQKSKQESVRVGLEHAEKTQQKVSESLGKLKQEYQLAQDGMNKMKASSSGTDKELEKQEKRVKELAQAIEKGERNYDTASRRVDLWRTQLNRAQTQVLKANHAVQQNEKYMHEAENATDKCAKSLDQYGKKAKNVALYADDMNTLATQTGVATDTLQELKYMENLVDVSLEQVTGSMAKNIKSMSKARLNNIDNGGVFIQNSANSRINTCTIRGNYLDFSNTATAGDKAILGCYNSIYPMLSFTNSANTIETKITGTSALFGGTVDFSGSLYLGNNRGIYAKDTSNTNKQMMIYRKRGIEMKKEHDVRIDRSKLHPWMDYKLTCLLRECGKKGIYLIVTEGFRTKEQQDALYAKGRTKPGKIVTNAKGSNYSSQHMWGIAVDFAINDSKKLYDTNLMRKVAKIAKSKAVGLAWGGDWKSLVDTPHLYISKWGSTTTKLKRKYGTPMIFKETWKAKVKRPVGLILWQDIKKKKQYFRVANNASVKVLFRSSIKWYAKVEKNGKIGYMNKKYLV